MLIGTKHFHRTVHSFANSCNIDQPPHQLMKTQRLACSFCTQDALCSSSVGIYSSKAFAPASALEFHQKAQDVPLIRHITKGYTPIVVIGALSPWNLPVILSFANLPALLASIVILSRLHLARSPYFASQIMFANCFRLVFNVVTGGDHLACSHSYLSYHPLPITSL